LIDENQSVGVSQREGSLRLFLLYVGFRSLEWIIQGGMGMMRTGLRQVRTVLFNAGALLAMGATAFAETPAIDPCKFLTPAEVESVMGKKLKGAPVLKNPVDEVLGEAFGAFVKGVTGNKEQEQMCGYEFITGKSTLKVAVMSWNILVNRPKPVGSTGSVDQVKVSGLGEEAMLERRRGSISAGLKALWGVKEDGESMDREETDGIRTLALAIRKGTQALLIEIWDDTAGDDEKIKALGKKAIGRW
jgi:hypothetical protein